MGASLHAKYLETSRASKAKWASRNRERINAKRRERRLKTRAGRLKGKLCLNCEVLLVGRLNWSPGRTNLYCRKCLTENREEARRHRWRRYYYRKTGKEPTHKHRNKVARRPPRLGPKKYEYLLAEKPAVAPKTKQAAPPKPQFIKRSEKSGVLVCLCGNRYLKTRQDQTHCLHCIAYGVDSRALTSNGVI